MEGARHHKRSPQPALASSSADGSGAQLMRKRRFSGENSRSRPLDALFFALCSSTRAASMAGWTPRSCAVEGLAGPTSPRGGDAGAKQTRQLTRWNLSGPGLRNSQVWAQSRRIVGRRQLRRRRRGNSLQEIGKHRGKKRKKRKRKREGGREGREVGLSRLGMG